MNVSSWQEVVLAAVLLVAGVVCYALHVSDAGGVLIGAAVGVATPWSATKLGSKSEAKPEVK